MKRSAELASDVGDALTSSRARLAIEYDIWTFSDDGQVMFKLSSGANISDSLFAFDMDGCLIVPKDSKKAYSSTADDWNLFHHSAFTPSPVPGKLRAMHDEGKTLAIISNQGGVSGGHLSIKGLQSKVDSVISALGVPIHAVCAIGDKFSPYRKPLTGGWDLLARTCCLGLDLGKSHFVGDAAGRPEHGKRKKDFSDSDFKLALNVGVPFKTPEHFFLNSKEAIHCDLSVQRAAFFDINSLFLNPELSPTIFEEQDSPEIVIIVAPAACGKSNLSKKFSNHERVNQDTLKTLAKCKDIAMAHLKNGKSVVVDNTNISVETRKEWITLARLNSVSIRAVYLSVTKELCRHLRVFRMISPLTSDEEKRPIDDMVMHSMFKNMVPPAKNEGFVRIDGVEFVPQSFSHPEADRLFRQFLWALEKEFHKLHGDKDESTFGFLKRGWKSFTKKLTAERMRYSAEELSSGILFAGEEIHFKQFPIDLNDECVVNCGFWSDSPSLVTEKVCFVYLHTNTRSMADALEVLPIVEYFNACLLAFDFPGYGKSEGSITMPDPHALEEVLRWAVVNIRPTSFVIWSRGSSSASTFAFLAELSSSKGFNISAVIFDTPFTSLAEVIKATLEKFDRNIGVSGVLSSMLKPFLKQYLRKKIKEFLTKDPYEIDSRIYLENIRTPCMIMSAEDDDYVPADQGVEIISKLCNASSAYRSFRGGHFGQRPRLLVMEAEEFLDIHIGKSRPFDSALSSSPGHNEEDCSNGDVFTLNAKLNFLYTKFPRSKSDPLFGHRSIAYPILLQEKIDVEYKAEEPPS